MAVTALLAVALIGPHGGAQAERSVPQTDYMYYPNCTWVTQGGLGAGIDYPVPPGEGITQPLGAAGNFATCILPTDVVPYSGLDLNVVYWDPGTLAPSAGTMALRSRSFAPTSVAYNLSRHDLFPPVITQVLASVAEPPPQQLAVEFRIPSHSSMPRTATLVENDNSSLPSALRILPDGTRAALPGLHPVFFHEVCGGDATLQALRVVQCVMATDATLDPSAYEYAQKFRVPVAASVRWIELAFASNWPAGQLDWGRIRIVDAAGQATPPSTFGTAIADANVSVRIFDPIVGAWDSHLDLPTFPVLQPDHDYWLVVNTVGDYELFYKTLTGAESPYFTTAIGGLYRRDMQGGGTTLMPGRTLSFRIIGTPTITVDHSTNTPAGTTLVLEVAPNPARGAATIAWAGSGEDVRIEVLDPRGRRVASRAVVSGASGRWTWNGAGDDGRAVPAGLYFVRARDSAGRSATTRVSLVR
ncbi:MAG: hypothetical protein ABIS67_10670 [Candidatus Eisenbacteria bacterium]